MIRARSIAHASLAEIPPTGLRPAASWTPARQGVSGRTRQCSSGRAGIPDWRGKAEVSLAA